MPSDIDAQTLTNRVKAFCRDHVAPHAAAWERDRHYPAEAMLAAGQAGLTGLMVPREHGGLGLGLADTSGTVAIIASHDMGIAFALKVHANLTASLATAQETYRRQYLDDLLAGRLIGAFLLTEPDVGSDATAITTRARRDGEGWVLEGEKAWVTNGVAAGLLKVFAQTDPSLGWRGIAAFLVEADADGVERLPAYGMLGGHSCGVCGFRFSGVRLDDAAMIHAPGEAFKGAMKGINIARAGVAAMSCGMMEAALNAALNSVAERRAFGGTLADKQGVQWMLADAATDLEAARLLTREAVERFDRGEDAMIACAHAKKFATRVAWKAIADCMQVMGARGFRIDGDHPVARHLACAKMAQWLDGATEVQNVVIARELLKQAGTA
jgi:alkylation response protein AidB-like acyl-CoA dehydrogenase